MRPAPGSRLPLTAFAVGIALAAAGCSSANVRGPDPSDRAGPPAGQRQGDDEGPAAYSEVITGEARSDDGVFGVHQVDDSYYFEIPAELLGRDMLLVSRIARVPAGLGGGFTTAGSKVGEQVVRWERQGDRILLRKASFQTVADDSLPIHQSVVNNRFMPIVASFDIEAFGPEADEDVADSADGETDEDGDPAPASGQADTTFVIEVTDFFESDVPTIGPLRPGQRRQYEVRRLDGDRTFINYARAYPLNVDVRHTLTFEASSPPSDGNTGTISLEMHQSMVLLPEEPMRPRHADSRVGYFTVQQVNFGLDVQKAGEQTFIRRWRMEPSDEAAYRRGELVDPVKPIVYYLDPATPEKWRSCVADGVEDWQAAFETAGFSNAIQARIPPTPAEDPEWSGEDVRYSVVRWSAVMTRNAVGPSVSDPRSGEIIESDIVWFHNHLRSYRNRLMLETGAANAGARSLPISDDLMCEAVRQVIAHEVGHALGLPHNMIASSSYPVDSLRNADFARRMGVSPSVMDYARQNYIAQPGDGLSGADFIRQIGPYDHYAINWGYRWIPDATTEEENETLDAWIAERADDPMYRFANAWGWNPEAQTEDLGDDPVAASGYGIMNLQAVAPRLIEWTSVEGEDYANLDELYGELVFQWYRYVNHVVTLVGGVHQNPKSTDQPGAVYTRVDPDRQREAVAFLRAQVFDTPAWLNDPEITGRLEHSGGIERIRGRQAAVLNNVLDPGRLQRVVEAEAASPGDAYGLTELFEDLEAAVWTELPAGRPVDAYRRALQRAHVERLEWLLTEEPSGNIPPGPWRTPVDVSQSDIRPVVRAQLTDLQAMARSAAGRTSDRMTRVHLRDIAERIDDILEGER